MASFAKDRVITMSSCRVFLELKDRSPLTEEEWQRFRGQIADCGLKGLPFDEVSYVYPLQIPAKIRIQVLQEAPRVVSVLGIYDRTTCVGIIGDSELEEYYSQHAGSFIFVVGKLEKCKKNDKEYFNLRPRGWLIVQCQIKDSDLIEDSAELSNVITKKRKKC